MRTASAPALAALLSACVSHPHDAAPAGPERPTFSSDTGTAQEGVLELEVGAVRDDEQALETSLALVLGATPRTEVSVAAVPYGRTHAEGGFGEVVLGGKHRFTDGSDDRPASAMQLEVKLPTSDVPGESDELDVFAGWMLTGAAQSVSWTAYYQLGGRGVEDGAGFDVEHGVALACGSELAGGGFSGFAELATLVRPERDERESFGTLGLALRPTDAIVLDVFVIVGLSRDVPDFAVGIGVAGELGRLFGADTP